MSLSNKMSALGPDADAPAPWVEEVSRRPIAFAQVREDATLDQWVVDQLEPGAAVLMVASGGCTAAALATHPQVGRLHLVDPNPAQIALSRLKLRLLASAGTPQRLSILGHAPLAKAVRQSRLAAELQALSLSNDVLGPPELVAEFGPDHVGRYEGLFSILRNNLCPVQDELCALLQLRDPSEQSRRVAPATPLGCALDRAFDTVMALPNLVGLFGEAATRNRCEPFSRHFARRTRAVLAALPAADNPYLWQMFRGGFPPGILTPWPQAASPLRLPEVTWVITTMVKALEQFSETFHYIHLSNILDWLSPAEAQATLDQAWNALRPGGWVLIRQLNSTLNLAALGSRLAWENRPATTLHERDRSFFYRRLHLGRKR